jgi:hypothetical protein
MERANDCSVAAPPASELSGNPPELAMLTTPTWLNLSLDAALGCRANVFEIHHRSIGAAGSSKKGGLEKVIFIHAQAVPAISRYVMSLVSKMNYVW